MNLFLDSFWRALAYCLHPRVIALSLMPLALMIGLSAAMIFFFWDPALDAIRNWLTEWALMESLLRWLESVGFGNLRSVVAPLLLLMLALPAIIILSLLSVAWFMTPSIVSLVAKRRFDGMARLHGGSFWNGVLQGIGSSVLAALALLFSMPLWLIPPLVLVLPPLIWGWLNYRVMSHDVLAVHASREEMAEIIRRHRFWMLTIGVLAGFIGAAPSMVWAVGAVAIVMAPLLVPLAIWIYTFVFAFSSLWFAHYALAALAALRAESAGATVRPATDESLPVAKALALPDVPSATPKTPD
jgi:hypothetical protein